ncbi:hypothetical protein ACQ4PT_014576 [Festuca glaucescens]
MDNIDIDHPFLATPAQLRALPNWRKRPIIRGPGIEEEYDFEAFIEYANRVKMSYDDFDALERLVAKYLPTIPLYVCTIKKSNIVKNKAKMYFSRRFTINHILPNIQLPATIKVYSRNANVAHVKMVMSMSTIINDLTSQSKASAQTKQNPSQNGEQSRSRQMAYNKDIVMESMKKELKDHIDTQLALVPKICAEEVLKMLNKNGVMYKPVEGSESDKGGDEEEDDSIHIDDSSKKEFMYKTSSDNIDALISNLTKNSDKYVTPPKHNGVQEAGDKVYVTPENVGLFAEHEVGVSSTVPTPQEIEATALYVKTISKIPKQASKGVYKNEFGATLSSQRLNVVLAPEWLSDDVIDAAIGYLSLRVGPDRMLCPAWRTNYLLELAEKQYRRKYTIKNIDDVVKRSGAIGRVMDEYFKREKTFFPMNIRKTHYVTVVMHTTKKEFQVLDPLFGLGVSKSVVEDLIGQISLDVQEANKTSETEYPDVEEWPIKSYAIPEQTDT